MSPALFIRPEHRIIADVLASMPARLLEDCRCWFGGGTAIVLKFGEYRKSLDIDFLCASTNGYRELRSLAAAHGTGAFFPEPVREVRPFRIDQYGLRAMIELSGLSIRFGIVREARINLAGAMDAALRVPVLSIVDLFAEKLLANADRCQDRAVAYRDALDLGMMLESQGAIPYSALETALSAYGNDVPAKLVWVTRKLADREALREAASSLDMAFETACEAVDRLADEVRRLGFDQ